MRDGNYSLKFPQIPRMLSFELTYEGWKLIYVHNFTQREARFELTYEGWKLQNL